jgi:acetoin utilization deacetylase AcuC-like enzyme
MPLRILYSEKHRLHAPLQEMNGKAGMFKPHPEVPQRATGILESLRERQLGNILPPRRYPLEVLTAVHDPGLIDFYRQVLPAWQARTGRPGPVLPDVFALRGLDRRPQDPVRQAGWYCFDPQTPLLEGTWEAALEAAACAVTGAELLLEGERLAYALCRPPGHHAGPDYYGGYCYLNNAALAARRLLERGRPAILDIDYHHGNGTQDIFYASPEVLFVSLHADPNLSYPCFRGYSEERGTGAGLGFTVNFPLPLDADEQAYREALAQALGEIRAFRPDFLVVSLGVDTVQGDPLGGLQLPVESFPGLGRMIGSLALPVLVVQEGGYSLRWAGPCVTGFLAGLSTP